MITSQRLPRSNDRGHIEASVEYCMGTGILTAFRGRMTAATLKRPRCNEQEHRGSDLPRSNDRGHIEATYAGRGTNHQIIVLPRSNDRGHIEAVGGAVPDELAVLPSAVE